MVLIHASCPDYFHIQKCSILNIKLHGQSIVKYCYFIERRNTWGYILLSFVILYLRVKLSTTMHQSFNTGYSFHYFPKLLYVNQAELRRQSSNRNPHALYIQDVKRNEMYQQLFYEFCYDIFTGSSRKNMVLHKHNAVLTISQREFGRIFRIRSPYYINYSCSL